MMHQAWSSIEEVPYCFWRSSIKFQGHTVQNITDFDPNWAFPDYRPVAAFKSLRFALFIISSVVFQSMATTIVCWKWTAPPPSVSCVQSGASLANYMESKCSSLKTESSGCQLPSSLWYKTHQISTLKWFSYCLAAGFAESLEARC